MTMEAGLESLGMTRTAPPTSGELFPLKIELERITLEALTITALPMHPKTVRPSSWTPSDLMIMAVSFPLQSMMGLDRLRGEKTPGVVMMIGSESDESARGDH